MRSPARSTGSCPARRTTSTLVSWRRPRRSSCDNQPRTSNLQPPTSDLHSERSEQPMRYIIIHKTNPHWESGAVPSKELIARVGALIGEMAKSKVFVAGEGLRASSEGVRLRFSGGARTITRGPFPGEHELPAGFAILRTGSLDEAVEWATRQAATL